MKKKTIKLKKDGPCWWMLHADGWHALRYSSELRFPDVLCSLSNNPVYSGWSFVEVA